MKYSNVATVSYELAAQIVSTGIETGVRLGINVSICVVDPSMGLVAFGKSDGATPHSVETSRRKANTAASTRRETGWMPEALELKLPLGANNLLTNIPGGHPIVFEDKTVGGYGVAGGTVEQDAEVAGAIKQLLAS